MRLIRLMALADSPFFNLLCVMRIVSYRIVSFWAVVVVDDGGYDDDDDDDFLFVRLRLPM